MLPGHLLALSIPLLAVQLSCIPRLGVDNDDGTGSGESETGESGDGDGDPDCTSLGDLVEGADPFGPPVGTPSPTCSTGWASDAPLRESDWAISVEVEQQPRNAKLVEAKALSGGGAVFMRLGNLEWFDGAGVAVGSPIPGPDVSYGRPDAMLVRDSDEHVFVAGTRQTGDDPYVNAIELWEFDDGELVVALEIPTPPDTENYVDGLIALSPDEWVIVGRQRDDIGNETFVMRVDSAGNELMRVGWSVLYPRTVTLDGAGHLLFGGDAMSGWRIVDPIDGAILASPELEATDAIGRVGSAGFTSVGFSPSAPKDATLSVLDEAGISLSTQTYDRATVTSDSFLAIANGTDGGLVVGGADGIWWDSAEFAPEQPVVIAVDAAGDATWKGRLAVSGATISVDVAADGTTVACGRWGDTWYPTFWIASWSG